MTNGINQLIAQGRPAPQWDWVEAKKNALALSQAEREYAGYPEEKNWLREQRGMLRSRFGQEQTKFGQEQEELPFKKEEDALSFLGKWGRFVNYRNYPDTRARLIKRGVNPDILPPIESFGGDENKFNQWLDKSLTTLEQRMKEREVEVKERGVGVEEEKGETDIGKTAMDVYGKSYRKLNPEEKKNVDERVKEGKMGEKTPSEIQGYNLSVSQGFKGSFLDWKKAQKEQGRLGDEEFYDRLTAKEAIKHLPKLKSDASLQRSTVDTIDKALALTKKGVTGKGGQLKAVLAGYAEMVGIETENLSDAQAFQALTRVIIGPMRLDIVGTGQVSDYENKLMKTVSGGGGTARAAALELLNHWRKRAISKIEEYNTTIEGISNVSPGISKVYKPITVPGGSKPEIQKSDSLGIR